MIALLDRDDWHHARVRELFEDEGGEWILPWAILPEVDYLVATRLGSKVATAFLEDLREGLYTVDGGVGRDLPRAVEILRRHASLKLGLVDGVVMAQAERHQARIIVTTDGRHFRAVRLS